MKAKKVIEANRANLRDTHDVHRVSFSSLKECYDKRGNIYGGICPYREHNVWKVYLTAIL